MRPAAQDSTSPWWPPPGTASSAPTNRRECWPQPRPPASPSERESPPLDSSPRPNSPSPRLSPPFPLHDALPIYGYPATAQQDWVARLLRACPPAAMILDAPCGTGQYFSLVAAAGHRVLGADQSAGMLAQARARGIAI